MRAYNFETPSLQSVKGIAVIFAANLYRIIRQSIVVIFVFVIGYFKKSSVLQNYQSSLIIVSILIFISIICIAALKYFTFKFHIDKNYFILNKGILKKEEITIPKSKIQNIHIKQNFIQQILNVVALNIETAGDDTTEIEISALSKPKALALKEALLNNQKSDANESVKNENTYFEISIKQLILEGISENHIKSLMIIIALFAGAYDNLKDLIDVSEFDSYKISTTELLKSFLFNTSLFVFLIFLAFLYSLIKIFITNFNLKIVKTNSGLEISKGLFNKVSLHLERKKIQSIRLQTNRLKKYFGLYSLRFSQIMESKKQKEYLAIIALNKLQAYKLIDKFYKGFSENLDIQKPEKYFMRILAIRYSVILLLLNIPLYLVSPFMLFINIPSVLLLIWHIKLNYKKNYFSIDQNYFVKGSGGIIQTNTDYLELKSIQAIEINQTYFQKRRHLASVIVSSAANGFIIPHVKLANAKQIVNYVLFKIESQDKNWM